MGDMNQHSPRKPQLRVALRATSAVLLFCAFGISIDERLINSQARRELHAVRSALQQRSAVPPDTNWADWVEPDFPFFSSVVDARRVEPGAPANLTPRGLVLNLGRNTWVAFDTDLLRVAATWKGRGVTPKALAPGSYQVPDRKTQIGQSTLPEPDGDVWLVNGIYPGWQAGLRASLEDPREPAPSPEEVGRGPLPDDLGRFRAVRLVQGGAVLDYTVSGIDVREWMTVSVRDGHPVVERHFSLGASAKPLSLLLGYKAPHTSVGIAGDPGLNPTLETETANSTSNGSQAPGVSILVVRVPPHTASVKLGVAIAEGATAPAIAPRRIPADPPAPRWPQEITTTFALSSSKEAYVVDEITLPVENPWRRAVRPGDIQFLNDGTGFLVTVDGDVWSVRGLHDPARQVRWRRFASGLHEPLTLAVRDDQIYVYDRNGIWRLRDTNRDQEADVHELFSNAFAQTADTREFPNTIRLAPAGEFVIAKGNQQGATIGKHNGHVLRISADGRRATVLGYGFRQPNLGVNVRTGLVTASDQQGNYIPSTPLHVVRDKQFYGFLSEKQPREVYPAPIAEPLTWIPHPVNASAMGQVWLFGARMGPLNDSVVHIGYNRPELFRVLLNDRASKLQAGVVSITRAFDYPPLNGSVNPADGQLYIAGFQILGWGTTATPLAGFGRVRYTGAPSTVPRELIPMDKGVLLRFDVALDPRKATNPDSYSVTSWQYKRTYRYGSPQLKADGTPGIDRVAASGAYLSEDGKRVFVAVPEMKPVMQMQLGWSLATVDGRSFQENAYFTPYELVPFRPQAEGFGRLTLNLSTRALASTPTTPVSAEEGRRLSQLYGCIACHSVENTTITKLGPTWKGLFGSQRTFADGVGSAVADESYLRESILSPTARVVSGYERGEAGMPSYAGVLSDAQIASIVLFIKTLK